MLRTSAVLLAVAVIAADRPEMTPKRTDVKPFEYLPADVPFYPPGEKWGTIGAGIKRMQKPLDPAESLKHYVHPVGFELRLFADESLLGGKPIAMTWDERGRCWVAVTVDYPNDLQPEGNGHDKILILEDTRGTGRADKVTVFADKLSIPTSLTMARGGVIVTQPPHTLFLRSTRGDDHADERTVLFTGWGTRDTHSGPSNLRYGPDNWIYGICGYSGFNGTVGGVKHRFQQGFFRFRPDGSALEFLRSTSNNSWGLGFSEEGLLFGSTANGCPSVFLGVPNRCYEKVRGWSAGGLPMIAQDNHFEPITENVRQVDFHGGFTAGAGHALYTARNYPKEYWNRTAFVSDPTGHLTATFVLEPHGADFRARYGWNLLASDDEWASPVAAEVGPDGNVWVIDWYAFIVQHNPTPPGFKTGKGAAYETPLRDKTHGRIYRLVPKRSPATTTTTSLAGATPAQLVAALK
ncbi:MAG TPA: PVC-type heme-binding CxxCH protein, partial [Gemmataceae bacterium]|nr:PVC-type heme-binding CxxCH protein [Gemmataceae bacterium]